ncbi:glycosyltransferase family 2 protein [Companilactobacillus sp.]|jgi:poly-beta-1,6 N-acetyl-D-glucosamine synthase|uniref:glycosyltransferase family 2 protein n=1 Tax=Companilactobacillus sp. TaxID=2767905 RepID=UPI0025C71749|nr:glycosyltransferase family 2 protein [Companilactobacillus sp.]MCH4009150.1 glycosyltransferase [Companilactobacillus sp.]MCH4050671.1 glycosyltransferase [Companilactobacillus sp.]MCH4077092.1 glycosyltransferase [Companilactobacillus sp.]MCH4125668.1 glycosyltransferase [Companilactobacillus sp.]MCI1311377.1 glycosyltransferase [Companilactobacillus sp.]
MANLLNMDLWIQLIKSVFDLTMFTLSIYPILGSFFWLAGSLCYRFLKKGRRDDNWTEIPEQDQPFITIMIPVHNEELVVERTIRYLCEEMNYSRYEILAVNDGSTDHSEQILERLQNTYDKLRVINVEKNSGKAHAFNVGINFARGDYVLSNDADTIPETNALMKYMNFFKDKNPNICAVTANSDVRNRSSLLGKSQTLEFSSIIGIIKRSQSAIYDSLYAYSGANTMYKKSFLIAVGGFRQDRITEDISIAWDHNAIGGIPTFAPNIISHLIVPNNFKDLYNQRKRWAQGGTEVWLANFKKIILHPFKRYTLLPLLADATFSIIWSFFFVITTISFWLTFVIALITGNQVLANTYLFQALVLISFELIAGMIQLLAAVIIDDRIQKMRYIGFAPLYILFYWIVGPITVVHTFPAAVKSVFGGGSGVWVSPTRKPSDLKG